MWILGTLFVLVGVEMVLRGRESYFASEFLRQYWQIYERFYDSDVMMDLASLLLMLFPWLFVWSVAGKWMSASFLSMLCVAGGSVSLYVWHRMRHRMRNHQRRFAETLCAGTFNRGLGVAFVLFGVLLMVSDITTRSSVP